MFNCWIACWASSLELISTKAKPRAARGHVAHHFDALDGSCTSEELLEIALAGIHGNKSQGGRSRSLADFKAGRVAILVATDIAARGLDIAQRPLVVSYDLPLVAEDYVHRVGRTGRAGPTVVASG